MPLPIAPDIDPATRPERALPGGPGGVEVNSGGHAESAIPGEHTSWAFEHEAGATYAVIDGTAGDPANGIEAAHLALESIDDYTDQYTRMPPQPKTRTEAKHHVIGTLRHINQTVNSGAHELLTPDRPLLDMTVVALTSETAPREVPRDDPIYPPGTANRRDIRFYEEHTTVTATIGNAGDGEVIRVRAGNAEVVSQPEAETQPKLGENGARESFKMTEVEVKQGDVLLIVSPQVREVIEADPNILTMAFYGAHTAEDVAANLVLATGMVAPGTGAGAVGIDIQRVPGPRRDNLNYDPHDISRREGIFANTFVDRSEPWDEILSPERIAEFHADIEDDISLEKAAFRATHGRKANRAEREAIAAAAEDRGIDRIMVEMIRGNELRDRTDELVDIFTTTHGFPPDDIELDAIRNQAFQEQLASLPAVADMTDRERHTRGTVKYFLDQPERSAFRESRRRRASQRSSYQARDRRADALHDHYHHKAERLSGRRFRQMARTAIEGAMDISADGARKTGRGAAIAGRAVGRGVANTARAVRNRLPI